jgi:hypothetical protein
MANPTTNYGFVLPTSSDLVTDLPADFDVALQGVDTRLKALQPGTTLGDLAYSSATANTNTRLGIGSNGQVLAVSGGVPAWTTPSAGAVTLISRTSFSSVASQTFDNVFTSTYKTYQISIESIFAATATDDLRFTFRYGTTDSGGHYGCVNMTPFNSATIQQTSSNNLSYIAIAPDSGSSTYKNSSIITVQNVPGSNAYPNMTGMGFSQENSQLQYFGGYALSNQTFTGFKLASSSSNITGIVSIYGLKDA